MVTPLQDIFVFDIETIPDVEAASALTECDSCDPKELFKALTDYHLEITQGKNAFLRQPFHKVVAISFLEASIERTPDGKEQYHLNVLRSGGTEESDEKALIQGFFSHLSKKCPRLVSYNGRMFDLPVLKYRAMKYGVSAEWLYKTGDKWENYSKKWSLECHCDLIDALSDFGASAKVKMNEVCSILGFPGKVGIDGSKVFDLYLDGEIKSIRDYCETDVLNTYLVYLRYNLFCGKISIEGYNNSIEQIKTLLQENDGEQDHFIEFYRCWNETSGGNIFMP